MFAIKNYDGLSWGRGSTPGFGFTEEAGLLFFSREEAEAVARNYKDRTGEEVFIVEE